LIEGDAPAQDAAAADDPYAAPAAPATLVEPAEVSLGEVLVDGEGLTLYGFTNDGEGMPTCNDACADAWPPLLLEGETLPDGIDPAVFSVVTRDDGTFQLKAGKWPLYRFAGDAAPGDANGQGSGGVWFATAPDGSLIK
jgi:predicted lipoprotein with Yx(FWY)xxD motif